MSYSEIILQSKPHKFERKQRKPIAQLAEFQAQSLLQDTSNPCMALYLRGRVLGIFSCSPDYEWKLNTEEKLRRFVTQNRIMNVICLDSRRINLYLHPQADVNAVKSANILPRNLISTYRRMSLPCRNGFNGVRFDLADSFELQSLAVSALRKKEWGCFQHQLSNPDTNEFFTACEASGILPASHKVFFDKISLVSVDVVDYIKVKPIVDKLVFLPHPMQIKAFIDCMAYGYYRQQIPYVHCASGRGRTALYLFFLLKSITGDLSEHILQFIEISYGDSSVNEIKQYLGHVDEFVKQYYFRLLRDYIQSKVRLWHNISLTREKKIIAQRVLDLEVFTRDDIATAITELMRLNSHYGKSPNNGRLYRILCALFQMSC